MVKINYPSNKTRFHQEYQDIFDGLNLSQIFCGKTIQEILTMSIEDIIDIKETGSSYNDCQDINTKNIFSYDKYQKKIAKFFMKYQKELNLTTCYFCNINYIYSFKNEYCDELDFVIYAAKSELESVKLIGDKRSNKIIKYREENSISSFASIPLDIITVKQKENIKSRLKEQYNHFTLDHLIEKSNHPLFALSLYNLIPSCSVCNSKFKHSKELVKNKADLKYIPSYKKNRFDKDVVFKFYFDDGCKESTEIDINKIKIVLKNKDITYRKYISVFKLYSRYQQHTKLVEDMINKSTKYSTTKIKQMATILSSSTSEIKKDIYGAEMFEGEIGDVPLTKLKRDFGKTIGVLS